MLNNTTTWLKILTKLKTLRCEYYRIEQIQTTEFLNLENERRKALIKFFLRMKQTDLEKIELYLYTNITKASYNEPLRQIFIFSNYPSTVKELSLSWSPPPISTGKTITVEGGSLSHMKCFETLNLLTALKSDELLPILQQIPVKSGLTHLRFNEVPNQESTKVRNILSLFVNLQSFGLKSEQRNLTPNLLNSLKAFSTTLRYIDLNINVYSGTEFDDLGNLLVELNNIQTIKLEIVGSDCEPLHFRILYDQIAKLSNLHTLHIINNIKFKVISNTKAETDNNPLEALINCFTSLPGLIEVNFGSLKAKLTNDLKKLLDELARLPVLKRLELTSCNTGLNDEDTKTIESFIKSDKVEELALVGFSFNDKNSFEKVSRAIMLSKTLKTLCFKNVNIGFETDSFIERIREIIKNRNIMTLWLNFPRIKEEVVEEKRISLKEVIKENPTLTILNIDQGIFKEKYLNERWELVKADT